MWPKTFIAFLAALCLLLVVGMSDYAYAEGSPYTDEPFGDEHPWGGDNIGDDGGDGLGGESDDISIDALPGTISTPYYVQSIPLVYFWNYFSRYIDKSMPSQTYDSNVILINRSTGRKSSSTTVSEGARTK